jgi:hypothetical protein
LGRRFRRNDVEFETTTICGDCHRWAPALGGSVAAIPSDWQSEAFQAAERSYLRAFRQLELSGPQTWASSVMRRLRRRVREAEKEKLTKLYEQLAANEHRSTLPIGQAHSFDTHQAALPEEQKKMGRELSADEQIGQPRSFAAHEAALSEEDNVGGELSADEQIGQARSLAAHEAALSEEDNVGGELSADEQIVQARSLAAHEAALSEEDNVGGELSADEQIVQARNFATHEAEQENVGRELSADEQIGQARTATHEAALSEEQNVGGELSADEQIGQARNFATHEAALSEEQNVGGELSADEQIGQTRSFATHEVASSGEQKNVARERVKKDAIALRMAYITIKVDEIFEDGRRPVVEKVRHIRES